MSNPKLLAALLLVASVTPTYGIAACTPTPFPTLIPTTFPTPAPTPNPCDDGSHGCDKSFAGICYKAGGDDYKAWTCGCKSGYHCTKGCIAPHISHTCALNTPAPTSYPTPAPSVAPTVSLDEVDGIKQCCAKNVPIQTLLPSLTCNDVRGKTDEELRSHIHGLTPAMTIPQIIEWLKAQQCMHTSVPTHVCKRTTCSYSKFTHDGVSYWHTLVRGDKNHAEHYHCEKHIRDGDKCVCLCNEEFTCTIVHHFKNGRPDGMTSPTAITQKNCAPPGPTNAPTTAPTPAPTPVPTGYPTHYPTPFPTPHPCDDGSHGCARNDGICYKVGGNGWTCGCRGGYHCTNGCSAPHNAHTCALTTASPTNYPTPNPTPKPDYWDGKCTVCPAAWYPKLHCPHGGSVVGERGCGFLGCEGRCSH